MAAFQSLAVPSALPVATSLPSGLYADGEDLSRVPGERHELLARVRVANARRLSPSRSAATKRDASGARATTCPMPVLRPTPGTAVSTREVASASCRACSASGRTVPSCRRVVSAASIASRMLRSGSTSRFASRGGGQLARRREAGVVSRLAAEDERERCEQRTPRRRAVANPASVARRLRARRRADVVRRGARLGEELALAGGEGEVGRARPRLELRQSALARQVLRIAPRVLPLRDRLDEPPVEEEVLATLFDPPAKPVPLGQDRLVRDLDGRRPRQRLAVEGEQPMLAVAREDLVERVGIELELAELAAADPAPRVLRAGVDADEAKEDLAARGLRRRAEARVEILRAAAERADDAAGRDVALERQHVGGAGREQLGQRVLQQRQGARLVADVGDDLGDEARLEANADASRRPLDRLRQLVLRGRGDRDHPGPQELPELRVRGADGRGSRRAA